MTAKQAEKGGKVSNEVVEGTNCKDFKDGGRAIITKMFIVLMFDFLKKGIVKIALVSEEKGHFLLAIGLLS